MSSEFQGLIMIIFGSVSIAFAKSFGRRAEHFQERFFRVRMPRHFLERAYLFGGLVFCIVGALALLGILQLRE
jgi:hypothetical protein